MREGADLTKYAAIGQAIASGIREIVLTGTLKRLEMLREQATPELAGISAYPRLDPTELARLFRR